MTSLTDFFYCLSYSRPTIVSCCLCECLLVCGTHFMQGDPSWLPENDHRNFGFMVFKCLMRCVLLSGSFVFHNRIGNIWLLINSINLLGINCIRCVPQLYLCVVCNKLTTVECLSCTPRSSDCTSEMFHSIFESPSHPREPSLHLRNLKL